MSVYSAGQAVPFTLLWGRTGQSANLQFKITNPITEALAYGPTNVGIEEDDPGLYDIDAVTLPSTLGTYRAVWIDLTTSAVVGAEMFTIATGAIGPAINGGTPGSISGLTFQIKRNDTIPYIRRQLTDGDGNPIDLSDVDVVMFNMRLQSDSLDSATPPKVHAEAEIISDVDGIVEYRWLEADTNLRGVFVAEFEATFLDGTIETFPQTSYITVTVFADLDPGIDP